MATCFKDLSKEDQKEFLNTVKKQYKIDEGIVLNTSGIARLQSFSDQIMNNDKFFFEISTKYGMNDKYGIVAKKNTAPKEIPEKPQEDSEVIYLTENEYKTMQNQIHSIELQLEKMKAIFARVKPIEGGSGVANGHDAPKAPQKNVIPPCPYPDNEQVSSLWENEKFRDTWNDNFATFLEVLDGNVKEAIDETIKCYNDD